MIQLNRIVQISRFGLVGAVATIVHVAAGLGLHQMAGLRPLWANLIAFGCALCVSFSGQTRLTFPDRTADAAAFVRFSVVSLTALAANQMIVWLTTSVFGGSYALALAIIIVAVPGLTFLLLKFWALRH